MNHFPVFIILIPLLQAFLMPVVKMWQEFRFKQDVVLLFPGAKILLGMILMFETSLIWYKINDFTQPFIYEMGNWSHKYGIVLNIDQLSLWFLALINLGMLVITFYSFDHIQNNESKYYSQLGILRGAMVGLVMTGDYFNLYIFLELISITSTALICFYLTPKSIWGAFQYLLFSAVGGAMIFLGIVLIYAQTGFLNMMAVAEANMGSTQIIFAYGLILIGNMIKVASFPFHAWLPAAHGEAEIPVSALLSGLLLKANFYMLMRIFSHGSLQFEHYAGIWIAFAVISIIAGHAGALYATQPKRILAYSSIANMGYAGLVYCVSEPGNLYPAMIVLAQHFVGKTFAFLSIGSATGQANHRIVHLYLRAIMYLSVLSLVGIPLLPGFWGKWFIVQNLVAERYYWLAALILLSVFPTIFYYRNFVRLLRTTSTTPYPCSLSKVVAMTGFVPALILFYYFLNFTGMA